MRNGFVQLVWSFLDKKVFVCGLVFSLVGTGLGLLMPQVIGSLLDSQFLLHLLKSPWLLVGMLGLIILTYVLQAAAGYLIGKAGSQAVKDLQDYLYQALVGASVEELEQHSAGDLSSRLTNDMSIVLNAVAGLLPKLFLHVLVIVGSVYFLFRISLTLTLSCLLLLPLLGLVCIPLNQKLEKAYGRYQEGLGEASGRISHKLTHVRLMKAFQGEGDEQGQMASVFHKLQTNFKKIVGWTAVQSSLVNSLMMLFILFQLLLAGQAVARGQMTMATLTTFVLYMMQLIGPVTDLADSLVEWSEFTSVSERLSDILNLKKEEKDLCSMKIKSRQGDKAQAVLECGKPKSTHYPSDFQRVTVEQELADASIELDKLTFGYGEETVLDDLSIVIPSGSHLAIVGPSGAGKSTIFSLLMNYYQDYQGTIRIGGRSLAELSTQQIRRNLSYIPQDNTLFHGSIRDNLLYGKNKEVSEERLAYILKELGLTKLVEGLENGLDTLVSESGAGLSEGQKQRFSIARALLLEHPIYLLDEVTASLDSVTERIISQAIDRLTAGKTRLTIAHRLHTVREADAILVLNKDGQIADYGSHQQLLERNGIYQDFLRGLPKAS